MRWCTPVRHKYLRTSVGFVLVAGAAIQVAAQSNDVSREAAKPRAAAEHSERRADLEAALSKVLSGAMLEGSFTNTGAGGDPAKLEREKYTLGEVKKVAGEVWQFPVRIQYGGKDVALPILLPISWAGDTPVVVVDKMELPGFGAVSARVMFFDGHYAGYWKHGEHSGNLYGVIHSGEGKASLPKKEPHDKAASSGTKGANRSDLPAVKKR